MKFEEILELVDVVSKSELTTFKYENEGVKIKLGKDKKSNTIVYANDTIAKSSVTTNVIATDDFAEMVSSNINDIDEDLNIIKSPLVGMFYSSPNEDSEPFVKVGDKVSKGQVIGIVEAMKLMNEIESDVDGEVVEILAKNASGVEYAQPLFTIK